MKKAFETPAMEVLRLDVADTLTNGDDLSKVGLGEGVGKWPNTQN